VTTSFRLAVRAPGQLVLHLLVDDLLPVGRAGNGLILADERMSRRHLEFRVREGVLLVRDCGSSNGTTVNGEVLGVERPLGAGDVVAAGDTSIEIVSPLGQYDDVHSTVVGTSVGDSEGSVSGSSESVPLATPANEVLPVGDNGALGPAVADVADESLRASIVGGTITMVFTDIVDSTDLVHQLADRRWLEVLGRHDAIIRGLVAHFHGTEVKAQGDGFLLTFPSARHALLFAISVQRDLAEQRNRDRSFPVKVRIGVHTGEVLRADGDVFGRHVHRAARIAGLARSEQIVVSSLVRELAEPMGDITFDSAHAVELKGFPGTTFVSEVQWERSAS
jgi:class 3 adenylate cyclase